MPESVTMGPYKMTFDLGNVGAYSISSTEQSEGDTLLGIPYTSYNATLESQETEEGIYLSINDLHEVVGNDLRGQVEQGLKSLQSSNCGEPIIKTRTTDGKLGVIGNMDCLGFRALYTISNPLDYNLENNSMKSLVQISSKYPWDEGTSSLVKTIHVENKKIRGRVRQRIS
ncbi:MAG: hypothetical protein LUQ38_06830 [Methanotrichaceae archaeon]|nr:hypothetical protein [Methanotrichaceae archaeon]